MLLLFWPWVPRGGGAPPLCSSRGRARTGIGPLARAVLGILPELLGLWVAHLAVRGETLRGLQQSAVVFDPVDDLVVRLLAGLGLLGRGLPGCHIRH